MLVTTMPYFIVQGADWHYGPTQPTDVPQPAYIRQAALATMVFCFLGFFGYSIYQVVNGIVGERKAKLHAEAKKRANFQVVLASMYMENLVRKRKGPLSEPLLGADGNDEEDPDHPGSTKRATSAARKLGRAWKVTSKAPQSASINDEAASGDPVPSAAAVESQAESAEEHEGRHALLHT